MYRIFAAFIFNRIIKVVGALGLSAALGALLIELIANPSFGAASKAAAYISATAQKHYYLWTTEQEDLVLVWSCIFSAAGNIITRRNQVNENEKSILDNTSYKVTGLRTSIGDKESFDSNAGFIEISTQYGSLSISRGGDYLYIIAQENPVMDHSETVMIDLESSEGVRLTRSLAIKVIELDVREHMPEHPYIRFCSCNSEELAAPQVVQSDDRFIFESDLRKGGMMIGGDADEEFRGTKYSDVFFGWKGNNRIIGGAGDDYLFGAEGVNDFYGGSGSDYFKLEPYRSGNASRTDIIFDFSPAEGDVISLSFGNNPKAGWHSESVKEYLREVLSYEINEGFITLKSSELEIEDFAMVRLHENFREEDFRLLDLIEYGHIILTSSGYH